MGASTNERTLIPGVGGVRISEERDRRKRGTLHSDDTQRETILANAVANGIDIVDWFDESNVSGGTPLERRPYGRAIKRVEDPTDPVMAIVFAYRSRHDRDVIEGGKAIARMDRAGGVLLVGGTTLSHATPMKWGEATMGSVMAEWQRRELGYAISKGVGDAVADGRLPYPSVPLGLELYDEHNHVRPVADKRILRIVRRAFEMRDQGATINDVRLFLGANGWVRSYRSVQRLLTSPLYIGEIHYGGNDRADGSITPEYVREGLFEPIVDPELWRRVQDKRGVYPGRYAKTDRLLSRLGILLCGGCGGRMVAGRNVVRGKPNTFYRCGRGKAHDCPARAVIQAENVERWVIERTKSEIADAEEHESAIQEARDADEAATQAEARAEDLEDKYMDLGPGKHGRALAKVESAQAAAEAAREYAERLKRLLGPVDMLTAVAVLDDTDRAALPAKREIIRNTLASVTVRPGRGALDERVSAETHRAAAAQLGT